MKGLMCNGLSIVPKRPWVKYLTPKNYFLLTYVMDLTSIALSVRLGCTTLTSCQIRDHQCPIMIFFASKMYILSTNCITSCSPLDLFMTVILQPIRIST